MDKIHESMSLFCAVPVEYYRQGGFYDNQGVLDRLKPVPGDGGAFVVVVEPNSYDRPIPIMAGDTSAVETTTPYFGVINKTYKNLPPVVIGTIENAVILHNTILLRDGEHLGILYETFRPCDRPATPELNIGGIGNLHDTLPEIDGVYCYLGSPGYFNYGHWLVDDLSRALLAVDKFGADIHWLIPTHQPQINDAKLASLNAALDGKATITFVDPRRPLRVSRVVYVSPTSYHPFLKSSTTLRRLSDAFVDGIIRDKRKLFVTRGDTGTRRLTNQSEIVEALVRLGYEAIDPGKMSFNEQRAAFAKATHVVGIMGAAMTNTVFCPDNTGVLYLAPDGWVEPFFWDLATAMGHRYGCVFGHSNETERATHLRDFHVDPTTLLTTLASL